MQAYNHLDRVLQTIAELSIEDQMYLSELLTKRLSEARRSEIANRVREAEDNYRSGNTRSGNITELMMASEND
jgi:hypothetical protein